MGRRRAREAGKWLAAALAITIVLTGSWLVFQAERKLSMLALGGLGESFSTRIWSAPFVVRAGISGGAAPELAARLDRLGYQRTENAPARGQYRWSPPDFTVDLKGFRAPFQTQSEGVFVLHQEDNGWRINDSSANPLIEIAFEPELAAELSGAQKVRRAPLSWEQIPQNLRDAVVSAEDKRFWSHWGIDPRAIARASWANLRGHDLQGASTITQQLTKNLFLSPRRTFVRKIEEAALAVYLSWRLDKKRVLTLYLNHIYLGQDGAASVMGMRAASRYYFNKETEDLSLPEAAVLAGLIRGPGYFSPFHDLAACRLRRDQVLQRMKEDGAISESELLTALAAPVQAVHGIATDEKRDNAYYIAEVVRELVPRYDGAALARNGLSIYTTMDPVLQSLAQGTIRRARHQAALVCLDPHTGDILALSGGRDFSLSQFNRATQALRQPGSAFKPFVYAAALKIGLTPATLLRDKPKTYRSAGRDWSPNNYDGIYYSTATMRDALAHSLNAATLDLAERVGVKRVQELARSAGVTSPLRNDLGLALGGSEVGLLELASAYEPFAAAGRRASPRLVVAVLDADGVLLESTPPDSVPVLDPAVAYLTTSMMESVVKEGSGRGLATMGFIAPAAGKTGTTNDGRDAWFVGYTPALLTGVWTGADDNRPLKLTGAKDALPLWASFMLQADAMRPGGDFDRPDGLVESRICADSGMRAVSGCPHKHDEFFISGTEPLRECVMHRAGLMGWFQRLTGQSGLIQGLLKK